MQIRTCWNQLRRWFSIWITFSLTVKLRWWLALLVTRFFLHILPTSIHSHIYVFLLGELQVYLWWYSSNTKLFSYFVHDLYLGGWYIPCNVCNRIRHAICVANIQLVITCGDSSLVESPQLWLNKTYFNGKDDLALTAFDGCTRLF